MSLLEQGEARLEETRLKWRALGLDPEPAIARAAICARTSIDDFWHFLDKEYECALLRPSLLGHEMDDAMARLKYQTWDLRLRPPLVWLIDKLTSLLSKG